MYKRKGGEFFKSTNKTITKRNRVEFRLDDVTLENLNYYSNKLKTTKTKVIEKGISLVKVSIKK